MSRAHYSGSFAKTNLTASRDRVRQRVKALQIHTIRSNDHFLEMKMHVKISLQNIHQRVGDRNQSLASTQTCKRLMPPWTEKSRWLNMDFENDRQVAQQPKNR